MSKFPPPASGTPDDNVSAWLRRNAHLDNESRINQIDDDILRDACWVQRAALERCDWDMDAVRTGLRRVMSEVDSLELNDDDEPIFDVLDLGFGDDDAVIREVARAVLELPFIY